MTLSERLGSCVIGRMVGRFVRLQSSVLMSGPPDCPRPRPMDPATVQSSSAGGQDLCPHFAVGDKLQKSLSLGDGSHPFPEDLLEDIRAGAGRPADGQPFFLHSVALNIQDSDHQFPRDLERGVPLGVTDPPLTLPGIWPLKKKLKGEEPEFQQLPHPTAGVTTPRRITSASSSGAHFWRRSPWAWRRRWRQHRAVAAKSRTSVPAP